MPTITNQIRRFRFEHGEMTQQELAERVGVTRQTIIAIEGGKYTRRTCDSRFRAYPSRCRRGKSRAISRVSLGRHRSFQNLPAAEKSVSSN